MTGVSWNELVADLVIRPTDPILCKATAIAKYLLVLVKFVRKFVRIEPFVLTLNATEPAEQVIVLSKVL